jgi:hypothetical protein
MTNLTSIFIRVLMLFLFTGCSSASSSNFQIFFNDFLDAALKNDYEYLISVTQVPLEVSGTLDFIPTRNLGDDELVDFFSDFFMEEVIISGKDMTILDELKSLRKANFEEDENKIIRTNSLVFQYINGKWLLVHAYSAYAE